MIELSDRGNVEASLQQLVTTICLAALISNSIDGWLSGFFCPQVDEQLNARVGSALAIVLLREFVLHTAQHSGAHIPVLLLDQVRPGAFVNCSFSAVVNSSVVSVSVAMDSGLPVWYWLNDGGNGASIVPKTRVSS